MMSDNVYANNEELACKAGMGKSICAFPDVCFTPPENPATPPGVPVPYPNTGIDSDTTEGSRTVQISGKEVMLKNKSYFKQSMGDEAGCASKKGAITSVNRGKVYFIAWSMDVKFEAENVVRNLDLTTHNHASPVANTPPQIFAARIAMVNIPGCETQAEQVKKACGPEGQKFKCLDHSAVNEARAKMDACRKGSRAYRSAKAVWKKSYSDLAGKTDKNDCQKALRCVMVPYKTGCCPGQTPDHAIDVSSFMRKSRSDGTPVPGWANYKAEDAPCTCAEGPNQTTATHGQLSLRRGIQALVARRKGRTWPRKAAAKASARAIAKTFPKSACSEDCLEQQINAYHDTAVSPRPERDIKANYSMTADQAQRDAAEREMFPSTVRGR